MFSAWARNLRFFLEANPVGCQNRYLLVEKGVLRKLFFIEKKLIVLKFGNWAKKKLGRQLIFFASLRRLDSTCLDEPFEKNFLKREGFFLQHVWTEKKKFSAFWIKFWQGCQNFVLRVHKNNVRKLSSEILQKFQFLLSIEQKFSPVCRNFFGGLSEASSNCRKQHFEGKFLQLAVKHKCSLFLRKQRFVFTHCRKFSGKIRKNTFSVSKRTYGKFVL